MTTIPKLPAVLDDDSPVRKVLYAGEKSATADREALARAKALKEQGADDAAIWRATGWFRGKDGAWRAEIGDENAKLREGAAEVLQKQIADTETKTYRVRDLLEHPELEKAYPDVMNMRVIGLVSEKPSAHGFAGLGQYRRQPTEDGGTEPTLRMALKLIAKDAAAGNVPFDEAIRMVLLHEMQHRLQDDEGWLATQKAGALYPALTYFERPSEQEAYDTNERQALDPQRRRDILPWRLQHQGIEKPTYTFGAARDDIRGPDLSDAPQMEMLPDHFFREAYAAQHGFESYLDMHMALLHPSTPREVLDHHLQRAWGGEEPAAEESLAGRDGEPDAE
jgi:conjugative element/phage-associated large polyvalent protein